MTATVWCWTTVLDIAKRQLTLAHKDFTKNPTATNWVLLERSMLAWQQLDYVNPRKCAGWNAHKHQSVLDALEFEPMQNWPDAICLITTGHTARDILTK